MSRNESQRTPTLSETDETVLAYIEENFGKKAAAAYRRRLLALSAGLPDSPTGPNPSRSRSRRAS